LAALPKCVVISNSQGLALSSYSYLDNFATYLGQIMGWNVFNASQGGTGYVNPGAYTIFPAKVAVLARSSRRT
jgi:hypothetical protein